MLPLTSDANRHRGIYPLADMATPPALEQMALDDVSERCMTEDMDNMPDASSSPRKRPASALLIEDWNRGKRTHEDSSNSDQSNLNMALPPDFVSHRTNTHTDLHSGNITSTDTAAIPTEITTATTTTTSSSTHPDNASPSTPPPPDSPNSALPSPVSDVGHADIDNTWSQTDEQQQLYVAGIIDTYETLPVSARDYFVFQLLRRCPMGSLRFANAVITDALKSDILTRVPRNIAKRILLYLDVKSLCRASQVSQTWNDYVERDADLWKGKLQEAGFPWSEAEHLKQQDHPLNDDGDQDPEAHPYKRIYRRHHIIRQNWIHNRSKRIQVHSHTHNVITCLQFDEDKVVTGSDDHSINIYDIRTGELRKALLGHDGGVWALQYTGNTLVTGSTDRTIRIWDMERGICRHVFRGHSSTVRCLLIVEPIENGDMDSVYPSRSEPLIVSGSRDSTLRVWRLPDLDNHDNVNYHLHTLVGHSQSVRALAAHGDILASGSYDHSVRIWDLETGETRHLLEGHEQKVYSVVLDPVRHRCISGSMDATVRMWSLEDGSCERVLRGHTILVGLLGIVDNYLVSAAADASLRVWSADGEYQYVLMGHQNAITSFQHDNNKVISGSSGGLKMWDIRTGRLLHDLIKDLDGVWKVAFDYRRCVAAVDSDHLTRLDILDFGVHGLEDEGTTQHGP